MKLEGAELDDALSRALTRASSGIPGMYAYRCAACNGDGIVYEFASWPDGTSADVQREVACGCCNGFGFVFDNDGW